MAGRSAGRDLPRSVDSPRQGRRFVARTLRAWGREGLVDDAQLVASELVTNAVVHAGSACRLELRLAPTGVWIGVRDFGGGEPARREPDLTGGRGLLVVERLSDSSRVEWDEPGPGKTVWCELRPA
jgi:anti-sigma regulatory factor (Ser/Thr protein kinase)